MHMLRRHVKREARPEVHANEDEGNEGFEIELAQHARGDHQPRPAALAALPALFLHKSISLR